MLNRLRWIAVSYLTHRAMWILVGTGALFGLIDLLASTKQPVMRQMYPGPPKSALAVNSLATLEMVRAEKRQAEVDSLDLPRLSFDISRQEKEQEAGRAAPAEVALNAPTESLNGILAEFPNLYSLTYGEPGSNANLKSLEHLTQLESLSLNDPLNHFDLADLATLSTLKRLQITSFRPRHDLDSLAHLPQLETVIFESRSAIDDKTLHQLAKLPALKTLVLNFTDLIPQTWWVNGAELEVLNRAPQLSTVYITSRTGDQRELTAALLTALPRRMIAPAVASADPPFVNIFHYLPLLFLTVAVSAQLATQLRRPASRLVPHYVGSHLAVAFFLLGLILIGTTARLIAGGAMFWPALLITAALQTGTLAVGAGTTLSADLQVPQRWPLVPSIFVLAFVGTAMLLWPRESLLNNSDPRLLGALALAIVAFSVAAVVCFERSVRRSQASGPVIAERERRLFDPTPQSSQNNFLLNTSRREREIEALGPPHGTMSWYRRVQHVRLGNQPLRIVRFSIFAFFVMAATQYFIFSAMGSIQDLLWRQLPFYGVMLLAISTSQIAMQWRHRMRILPLEVLRPRSRHSLQSDWVAAFALDLLPLAAIFAAITTTSLHVDPSFAIERRGVFFDFAIFFGIGWAAALAMGSLIVVIQRGWLAMAVNYGLFMFCALGVGGLALLLGFAENRDLRRLTFESIMSAAWFPLVVCLCVAWWMRRKFFRLELGART